MEDLIWKVKSAIRDSVYEKLQNDHDMYESEIYRLDPYKAIEDEIEKLLLDPKVQERIAKSAGKTLLAKHKENERKAKKEYANNQKLWKITKGKIPCLNECGHYSIKTEKEVLSGDGLNFICAECVKEIEKDESILWGTSSIFQKTNIWQMHGIIDA